MKLFTLDALLPSGNSAGQSGRKSYAPSYSEAKPRPAQLRQLSQDQRWQKMMIIIIYNVLLTPKALCSRTCAWNYRKAAKVDIGCGLSSRRLKGWAPAR